MMLLQFKDVPLRTRRALSPLTLYNNSALLVLSGTSLNCRNALLALNWWSKDVSNYFQNAQWIKFPIKRLVYERQNLKKCKQVHILKCLVSVSNSVQFLRKLNFVEILSNHFSCKNHLFCIDAHIKPVHYVKCHYVKISFLCKQVRGGGGGVQMPPLNFFPTCLFACLSLRLVMYEDSPITLPRGPRNWHTFIFLRKEKNCQTPHSATSSGLARSITACIQLTLPQIRFSFLEGAPFHEIDENRRQTNFRSPYIYTGSRN